MRQRTFGRLGWKVSEVGYGMWSIGGDEGGWTGGSDEQSRASLDAAVALGCNFFDTAWAYGDGHSEKLLGELVRRHPDQKLYVATKIPPKNRVWPSTRQSKLEDVFPEDYIREYAERSLANLGLETIDLLQFHVWEDSWAEDPRWQRAMESLKQQGKIRAVGISINRWEPWNVLRTLRTGWIDAVQLIYNIFDQAAEDELIPLCQELGIGVIARCPLDEGALSGTLTKESRWPDEDWRSTYFVPENLIPSVEHADRLKPLVPEGMTMATMALKFVLHHPGISTMIPGMRKLHHVQTNMALGDEPPLPPDLLQKLKLHRWDRTPTWWSQ